MAGIGVDPPTHSNRLKANEVISFAFLFVFSNRGLELDGEMMAGSEVKGNWEEWF